MARTGFALLQFDPAFNPSPKKKLRDGLSAVVQVADTLWVANDESASLERLTHQGRNADGAQQYGGHTRFALHDYLRLPVPPAGPQEVEEADIEGLDCRDGYLWVVGSHGLKRKKPDEDKSAAKNAKRLEEVARDGNRFLLARIPLAEEHGTPRLKKAADHGGRRLFAAQLRGDNRGDDLMEAMKGDGHLAPFLGIPGKDNGFDVEGLAVAGKRLFLGLRGPVLRGWAVILELEPEELDGDASTLTLKKIGTGSRRYRKHFLQLGGLGVRDLCLLGPDLLILAGPTMDLDGPVEVFCWPGGAQPGEESFLFGGRLSRALTVPHGQGDDRGSDHAEGMTLFATAGGTTPSVLVVYDSAAERRKEGANGVAADVFSV